MAKYSLRFVAGFWVFVATASPTTHARGFGGMHGAISVRTFLRKTFDRCRASRVEYRQLQSRAAYLPIPANLGSKGYLAVKIVMDDEAMAKELPLGAAGTTAIYTDVGNPFHVITLVTVRIKAWMNYVPL